MRKPTWWDLGIAVLGLFLVCGAAQGMAQTTPYGGSYGGMGSQPPSTDDSSGGDVSQDPSISGTPDGMGSSSGLVTDDIPQDTGTGGAGTAGQATDESDAVGTTEQGMDTETQPASVDEAQQRLDVARLRTEAARLEQQLAQTRAQLSAAESGTGGSGQGSGTGGSGVEGSGSAGVGDANAEAPGASTGVGDTSGVGGGGPSSSAGPTTSPSAGPTTSPSAGPRTGGTAERAPDTRPDTSNQGYAEAVVIYTGRIRSVNAQRLELEDSGFVSTMPVAPDVRVLNAGKQQVSLQSLREGTSVRVSANLYTKGNPVTEIQVLPAAR